MNALSFKNNASIPRRDWLQNILHRIERHIDLFPHPVTVLFLLNIILLVLSGVMAWLHIGVIDPRPAGIDGRPMDNMIYVISLLNIEGIYRIATNLVHNFAYSAGLGTVLVVLMGVGIADYSGLLKVTMRILVTCVPPRMLTVVIMLIGVMTNISAELGYVVFIPLAAIAFQAAGRHPIAGIAAAFAAVSGGYTANIFLGRMDPVLAAFTEKAAQMIDPAYIAGPEMNWYFMCISVLLVTLLGTWVTERIVEPRLGGYIKDSSHETAVAVAQHFYPLTKREKYGLFAAVMTFIGIALFMGFVAIHDGAFLHETEQGDVVHASFMDGLAAFIFVLFALPGLVYGIIAGSVKKEADIIKAMSSSISTLGVYMILVFLASQFAAFFKWTNIGLVISIKLVAILNSIELPGPILFFVFMLLCATLNLFIGSAGIKWAIFAPVFVPTFMMMGFSPELTQVAYRIGDSVTNIITPMMSYFGITLAVAMNYNKKMSIGSFIATMLPYSVSFFIGWSVLFYCWVFALNLPVGPDSVAFYQLTGR